ncbi:MAG: NAD(P)-dependent glycerol-3-phosphate dehydrogenase [Myxococcales bacterium FL481]|nr:MAG: NAD(P)-dependent glycerol-3-phosphate dehydrogenase [Myxococcales bacterium FL481]
MPTPRRIAVLGAGSWGTALAIHLSAIGHAVGLWARDAAHANRMRAERANARYLPGRPFPPGLTPTDRLVEVVTPQVDLVLFAVPSHATREMAQQVAALNVPGLPELALVAAKGIEVDSLETMEHVVAQELPALRGRVAVLGGPSFADEVAQGQPTTVVVGCRDRTSANRVQHAISGGRFRAYVTDDVAGVELGGTYKNVIAVAAGIGDGAGYGQNARAALITRGLAEMSRLAVAMGAKEETLSGLAGLGDLVLTCTGGLSRNRRVGLALGQGRTLDHVLAQMGMVAEGVRNTKSVYQLGQRHRVELPIVETMHDILYDGLSIEDAAQALLRRTLKGERG